MKVQELGNGQFEVTHNNLILTQTVINGHRFNDCSIKQGDHFEIVSQNNELFKPLFIALHNYKNEKLL